MAKSTGGRRTRRDPRMVLQPVAWSALLATAAAIAFANPVYADPGKVPDNGSRPAPAGALYLPGAAPTTGPSAPNLLTGPLTTKIAAKEIELAQLGEKGLQLQQDHELALGKKTVAETEWHKARAALADAEKLAAVAATEALKDEAALPPGMFGSDLHGLSRLGRDQWADQPGAETEAAARAVLDAQQAERTAYETYQAAEARVSDLEKQLAEVATARELLEAELLKLKKDNADQLAAIEREQEALDQRLGRDFVGDDSVAGKVAHPDALRAVQYALNQLGDPYQWGAEGPDRFDCSGLTWAAYRSVGYRLPRVAKDQYYATRHRSVDRSSLLPGDLVFFASGSSWRTIHHMGMYIGNGKMVHAPTTGDVVKISTVRWSRLYAATRVLGAVPAPATKPSPTPSPKPSPKPSPTPSPTPTKPKPSPTPPPDPTSPPPTTEPEETPVDPEPPAEEPAKEPEDSNLLTSGLSLLTGLGMAR